MILLNRSGAIIEMHKPIIRNDAGVVDGNTAKHAPKISTRICSIFHISRDTSDIDRRSLWYMSDVHIWINAAVPSIIRRGSDK